MANMFSGNVTKRVPQTFEDCIKPDPVSTNLWTWSERLEKWGAILCVILAVIGVISIIFAGVEAQQTIDQFEESYDIRDWQDVREEAAEYEVDLPSVFEVVVESLFQWIFYCFLEYCAYHILALLVGSLATIVQNSKISADVALYNTRKETGYANASEDKGETNVAPPSTEEKYSYAQATPQKRAPEREVKAGDPVQVQADARGRVVCPNCGTEQRADRLLCFHCGTPFVKDEAEE